MTRRTCHTAVVVVLAVAGLGLAACTGSDNGGVITGTTPTTAVPGVTTTSGVTTTGVTTTTALPGGTLPAS